MEAIILAGGLGQRLRPRVPGVPKPLAPIRLRPFLEYLFDYLIAEGILKVTVAVGYGAAAIREYFKEQYRGLAIQYSTETEPLGTGGALKQALRMVTSHQVFVVNGDTFAQVDYRRMAMEHQRGTAPMAMAVKYLDDTSRYGKVNVRSGLVISFESGAQVGSGHINAGVYLIYRDILERSDLPETFSFEKDFLAREVGNLRPQVFFVDGYFIDIGVPEDYERAQIELPEWK
ncbi:MAG: nucleotidyltransferase family protein [Nitrospira defluvii]|nr:nucleotidyltransferase family protein [Nitrospira defluvii]